MTTCNYPYIIPVTRSYLEHCIMKVYDENNDTASKVKSVACILKVA